AAAHQEKQKGAGKELRNRWLEREARPWRRRQAYGPPRQRSILDGSHEIERNRFLKHVVKGAAAKFAAAAQGVIQRAGMRIIDQQFLDVLPVLLRGLPIGIGRKPQFEARWRNHTHRQALRSLTAACPDARWRRAAQRWAANWLVSMPRIDA